MKNMTQERHEALRNEIRSIAEHLRSTDFSEEAINMMEMSALELMGGEKGAGPEITVIEKSSPTSDSTERHESYGQVKFSRITCMPPQNLYGSNIRHGSIIELSICRSNKIRSLSQDHYYGHDEIVSVYLSPAQFSELLTSLNIGSGVPCTIESIFNCSMSNSPEKNQRKVCDQEFKKICQRITEESESLIKEVQELFGTKKNIGKQDRADILGKIKSIKSIFNSSIPFMGEQYTRHIDGIELDAKTSVDAFITNALSSIGVNTLNKKLIELPETIELLPLDESQDKE